MGSKTRLRLPDTADLSDDLRKELFQSLKNIIGPFSVEKYPVCVDVARSYQRRVNTLNKAMDFIVESILQSLPSSMLKSFREVAENHFKLFHDISASITTHQTELTRYTAYLTNILVDYFPWETFPTSHNERSQEEEQSSKAEKALNILNKAEQYILLLENRPSLATLVPIVPGEFALLYEKPLSPYGEKTFQDFSTIQNSLSGLNGTIPAWFDRLSPVLQQYLHTSTKITTVATIRYDLYLVEDAWKEIKTNSSSFEQFEAIAAARDIEDNNLPSWFSTLNVNCKIFLKILFNFSRTEKTLNDEISKLAWQINQLQKTVSPVNRDPQVHRAQQEAFQKEIRFIKALPNWFLTLLPFERSFLVTALKTTDDLKKFTASVPSRLRTIPALANGGTHQLWFYREKQWIAFPVHYRSSHIASRDVAKDNIALGAMHATRNLTTLMDNWIKEEQSEEVDKDSILLIQTLVSPEIFPDTPSINGFITQRMPLPDKMLHQTLYTAIKSLNEETYSKIFFINHPLNSARLTAYTEPNNPECNRLWRYGHLMLGVRNMNRFPTIQDRVLLEKLVLEVIHSFSPENTSTPWNQLAQKTIRQPLSDALHDKNSLASQHEDALAFKQRLSCVIENYLQTFKQPIELAWPSLIAREFFIKHQPMEEKAANTYRKQQTELTNLLNEYKNLLTVQKNVVSAYFQDPYARELFLSSLEHLIITHLGGISMGSCVSGKDRKGIQILHTDAMILYREKYGHWPSAQHTGSERKNFVKLSACLYVSRHAHEHAGQNVPGADGIKTPQNYWPADIAAAITDMTTPDLLDIDERLAENNELSKLQKHKTELLRLIKPDLFKHMATVQKLPQEQLFQAIDLIRILSGEKAYWNHSLQGIQTIKHILEDKNNDVHSRIYKLASIFLEANKNLEVHKTDKPLTQKLINSFRNFFTPHTTKTSMKEDKKTAQQFYNIIVDLSRALDPTKEIENTLKQLDKMKDAAIKANTLEENKRSQSSLAFLNK